MLKPSTVYTTVEGLYFKTPCSFSHAYFNVSYGLKIMSTVSVIYEIPLREGGTRSGARGIESSFRT